MKRVFREKVYVKWKDMLRGQMCLQRVSGFCWELPLALASFCCAAELLLPAVPAASPFPAPHRSNQVLFLQLAAWKGAGIEWVSIFPWLRQTKPKEGDTIP